MLTLKKPYISVSEGGQQSYGGSQMRLPGKTECSVGCGVIAGLDLLLYLASTDSHADLGLSLPTPPPGPVPLACYIRLAKAMRRRYLPLIPGHGINGLMLALGINRCFLKARLPYRAFWGVPYTRLWDEIEVMLRADIPVVFSIGPNFPLFWQHERLTLYQMNADGLCRPAATTQAHYVTVTGMDDNWLRISSWGKQYFIKRTEYLDYVRAHSARFISNILVIRAKH